MLSIHDLSKRNNIPEWGNYITEESSLFCPHFIFISKRKRKKHKGERRKLKGEKSY
jgi:hypothetical protein